MHHWQMLHILNSIYPIYNRKAVIGIRICCTKNLNMVILSSDYNKDQYELITRDDIQELTNIDN